MKMMRYWKVTLTVEVEGEDEEEAMREAMKLDSTVIISSCTEYDWPLSDAEWRELGEDDASGTN